MSSLGTHSCYIRNLSVPSALITVPLARRERAAGNASKTTATLNFLGLHAPCVVVAKHAMRLAIGLQAACGALPQQS